MNFKTVRLIIPFLYDLGGSIRDDAELKNLLKKNYPMFEIDKKDLLHYNISHLSMRKSTYTLLVEDIEIKIGNFSYPFNRKIKIYPQGVLSISYSITFNNISATEIIAFYEKFYEEKNLDYVYYLTVTGSIKNSLENSPKIRAICTELEKRGTQKFNINNVDIYRKVSGIIAEKLEQREENIIFMTLDY